MAKAPYLLTEAGRPARQPKENGPNAGPPCSALALPGSRPSEGPHRAGFYRLAWTTSCTKPSLPITVGESTNGYRS